MGTWGQGPFETDGGLDFVKELRTGRVTVWEALDSAVAVGSGDYLDLDDGAAAWSACELVATAYGACRDELPREVRQAVMRIPLDSALVGLSLQALDVLCRVEKSELASLWSRHVADGLTKRVEDLRNRLLGIAVRQCLELDQSVFILPHQEELPLPVCEGGRDPVGPVPLDETRGAE